VVESARQFSDDLQQLITALENGDSELGLALLRNAVEKQTRKTQKNYEKP
jgi:hypothetical protein